MSDPLPDLPYCRNHCICRVKVIAREASPIEMVCIWCEQCHELTIATRLPGAGPQDFQGAAYQNITDDASLTGAIEQESFRLGLPKPTFKRAEAARVA